MDEETILYIGSTSVVALLLIFNTTAFGQFDILVSGLAVFSIVMLFVINYADFIIFPLITLAFGIKMVPAKGYYIPKNSNSIVKLINGIYYATGYLTANVYNYVFAVENVDENEEAKLAEGPDKWEKIVMNAGFPFKFNIISVAEDIQKYREELEGKRGMLEFQVSKEMNTDKPDEMMVQDLQRKMSVLDARINKLSGGERPLNALMYIETTAVGVSEKEAVDALTNQLSHLETLFNSFDLSITRVIGRELYYLFTFNYMLPESGLLLEVFSTQA
jgi:hypothetical protein